jgi:hypothetical protein
MVGRLGISPTKLTPTTTHSQKVLLWHDSLSLSIYIRSLAHAQSQSFPKKTLKTNKANNVKRKLSKSSAKYFFLTNLRQHTVSLCE